MRAIIQRVTRASVTVNGGEPRKIGPGLVILLGVRDTDDSAIVPKLAEKCAHLRIFEDENGKLNRSAVELGYSALVVSNFTLYGDTAKGKRPSFIHAAKGELAVPCYEKFLEEMGHQGLKDIQHGEFGADMKIDLVNDGPVTIVIDTDEWKKYPALPRRSAAVHQHLFDHHQCKARHHHRCRRRAGNLPESLGRGWCNINAYPADPRPL